MISLQEYIYLNEGVFDVKAITYNDFKIANQTLELCSIEKDNIQNKAALEKIYFNTDLKLPNGSTVKKQVNANKALFKRFGLSSFVDAMNTNDMKKFIADSNKIDIEIGTDTYTDTDGTIILRNLKVDNKEYPMMIVKFNV